MNPQLISQLSLKRQIFVLIPRLAC